MKGVLVKRFEHRSVIACLARGVAISFLLFFLFACSDDDSEFISRSDRKGSSSSVTLDSNDSSLPPCKMESKDGCEYGILVDDRDNQTYKTVKRPARNLNHPVVGMIMAMVRIPIHSRHCLVAV